MTCGIYCYIDSTNNSIVYIGQSVNMERRHTEHLSLARYNDQPFNAIKTDMFKYKTEPRPRRVFILKYNTKLIRIGGFLDFITCELLHDLIDKEVNDVSS